MGMGPASVPPDGLQLCKNRALLHYVTIRTPVVVALLEISALAHFLIRALAL